MEEVALPFRPGSVSWDVLRRPIFFIGGMNALLLQIAEPRVARGVAEHSDFTNRIFGRLKHTIELMVEIGLAEQAGSERAIAAMTEAHRGVRGSMPDGSTYDAAEPGLRLWVLATLIATVLQVEEKYVGEYEEPDRERYYRESLEVARVLGVDNAPETLEYFRAYIDGQIDQLEVTVEAKEIARHVIHPRLAWIPASLWAPMRWITADLLPARLRTAYDIELNPSQERWVRRLQSFSRARVPRLPDWVRTFPVLRPLGGIRDRVTGAIDPSLVYRDR